MATGPDLRIGDSEREAAATRLREHFAQGRLTLDEFNHRLDAVFAATTQRQLSALSHDLPHIAAPPALALGSAPVTAAGGRREQGHQEHGPGPRSRLGVLPAIMAALAAWLLIFDLHLRIFPWPGRLGIALLIFGVIRGLMRRVWHLGRGGGRGRR
jgi:Domain of unknown function (DUF1707)